MRMIKITDFHDKSYLINTAAVTCIYLKGLVCVKLSCGGIIETKFTTIDHALDYIQRASSHSLVGG